MATHVRGGQEIMPANDTDNDDVQSMDQLVHDFNTALDETAGSNSSSRSSASRRKVSRDSNNNQLLNKVNKV